jgi:hypothetical protein
MLSKNSMSFKGIHFDIRNEITFDEPKLTKNRFLGLSEV